MALITVGSETTRLNAETIGQAWRTLISRFTNVKLGKYVSEEGEDLNNVETILKQFGITLRDSSNEWRNLGEVIDEIGSKWDSFSSVEKSAIATQVAGVQRANIFIATMENYSKVVEATGVSQDAAGTAAQKYEHVMDSLDAKINQFIVTWEKLVNNLNQSGTFGAIVDFGTSILELVDNLNLIENSLMVIVPLLAFKGIEAGVDGFNRLVTEINQSANAMNNFKTASKVFDSATVSNLNGYTELIIKLKDAQSGLSEETVRYQGIQLKIDNTEKQRSKTIESILDSTKNLTNEELARVMAQQKVNKATAAAVLQQRGMNQTLIESTLSAAGYTGGINGASVATTTFGASVKAATVNLLAMAKAWIFSPGGIITLSVIAITGLSKALDYFNVTLKESKENLDEAMSSYEESANSLKELNNELETNKSRLEELENIKTPTYAEEEEIKKLKEANELLETQIELKKMSNDVDAQRAILAAQQTLEKYQQHTGTDDIIRQAKENSAQQFGQPINADVHSFIDIDKAVEEENLRAVMIAYQDSAEQIEEINAKKNGTLTSQDRKTFEEQQDIYLKSKDYLLKSLSDIQTTISQLTDIDVSNFAGGLAEKEALLADFERQYKEIMNTIDPGSYEKYKINSIISDPDYADIMSKFKQIADSSNMTQEEINKLFEGTNIDAFMSEMQKIDGIRFDQVVAEISRFVTATKEIESAGAVISDVSSQLSKADSDFTTGMQNIIDTYSTLQGVIEEYNNAGYLSVQTIIQLKEAGIDYNDYLVENNGQMQLNKQSIVDMISALYDQRIETLENAQAQIKLSIDNLKAAESQRKNELSIVAANNAGNTMATNMTTWTSRMLNYANTTLMGANANNEFAKSQGTLSESDLQAIYAQDETINSYRNEIAKLSGEYNKLENDIIDLKAEQDDWEENGDDLVDRLISGNERYASSSASTANAVSNEFQEAYDEIQYMRDRGLISEEEYLNRLYALNEKYNKDNLALWRKYDLEIYKGRQQLLSDRKQSAKDRAQEAADRKKKAIDKRIEALRDELDALNEKYEAEDKAFELQKAQDRYNAAIATKNTRVYTNEKGWVDITCPG